MDAVHHLRWLRSIGGVGEEGDGTRVAILLSKVGEGRFGRCC